MFGYDPLTVALLCHIARQLDVIRLKGQSPERRGTTDVLSRELARLVAIAEAELKQKQRRWGCSDDQDTL